MNSFNCYSMNLNNSENSRSILYKKVLLCLLISGLCRFETVFCQNRDFKFFKDSCCQLNAKPLFLKQGDKVMIGCDSAILINAYRYHLYEKARNYLVSLAGNTSKMAFKDVEGSVNQLDMYFSEIQSRYFILSEEIKKTASNNIAALENVNKELDQARSDLKSTKNELVIISEQLKRTQRKSKTNKMLYGGLGIGAGLLLGAMIIH
jgi:hypothetical protein